MEDHHFSYLSFLDSQVDSQVNCSLMSWNRLHEAKLSQHTLWQITVYEDTKPQEARKHRMC